MSKEKYVLSAIVVSGLVVAMGVSMYVFSNPKDIKNLAASGIGDTTQIEDEISQTKRYRDEAGFTFSYPLDVAVTDATPDVGEYYSILNIQKGSEIFRVSMEDSQLTDIDQWLVLGSDEWELTGAVSIDGIAAKQYKSATHFVTVAVDEGVLYILKYPRSEDLMEVYDLFVSSFEFEPGVVEALPVANSPSRNTQIGGAIIYDPVEIIE